MKTKKSNMDLDIKGMDKLFKNLDRIKKDFEKEIEKIINEGAKLIKKDAKSRVPVDSGDLKKSIKVKKLEIKKNRIKIGVGPVYEKGGDDDVFYWYFVEFGHPESDDNYPAQPYLRPAFEKNKRKVKRTIKKEINKLLEKVGI